MPRSKNWKNSKAKKGNSFRGRYKQTDQTGNPGNFKLRSTDMDLTEDPCLVNHRTRDLTSGYDCWQDLSYYYQVVLSWI
jgi:hypothetical protein